MAVSFKQIGWKQVPNLKCKHPMNDTRLYLNSVLIHHNGVRSAAAWTPCMTTDRDILYVSEMLSGEKGFFLKKG